MRPTMSEELSHLDDQGRPNMVDVSSKTVTARKAVAQAIVRLPDPVAKALSANDGHTKKGSVFQTASLAGTMAAKQTSTLIPLCHPIGLDHCHLDIVQENDLIRITATTAVAHKTGVEMEAMTAASVAALTIYDMCKGLSHGIVIEEIRLLEKTGGKSDFHAP